MKEVKITDEATKIIEDAYQQFCTKIEQNISIEEFLQTKLLSKNSFENLLELNELLWIKNYFNKEEIKIISSKYYEKLHYFREGKHISIDNKFKISNAKNCASEMFVQKEFDLLDLRAQPFKVIFCSSAKLNLPEWKLISHRRVWFENNKPFLKKKYGVIVTLTDNNSPRLAAIIDKFTFNKYATYSEFSDQIIIHTSHFQKALTNKETVLQEFNNNIIYQTHIDLKSQTALNRLRKNYFSELKNAQEMFELLTDYYYQNLDTHIIQSQLQKAIDSYRIDSKKRLLNYCRIVKNKLNTIRLKNKIAPDILIKAAFNNPDSIASWYRNS